MSSTRCSDEIRERQNEIAATYVGREFARHPELKERYGATGRQKSLDDAGFHLSFLAQAISLDSESLFVDYVAWTKVMLAERGVLPSDLEFHLRCLAEVLEQELSSECSASAAEFVRNAIEAMPSMPDELPTFLAEGEPLSPLAHQYLGALLRGERHAASRLVLDAVESGTSVRDVYLHVFQTVQREIGRLWQSNEISVAQEHYCTAATQMVMSQLYPRVFSYERKGRALVATCIAGDLHELGVRMVADFFEMDGWDTYYLGANTPHRSVIDTIVSRGATILAVSATIPYHIDAVRELISAVRDEPSCDGVKIIVGGYPFNRDSELWRTLEADGTARDAEEAVELGNRIVKAA